MIRITSLALILLLAACASQVPDESAMVPVVPQPPAEPAPVVERSIPPDSVYALLVAEFALRRQAYDFALDRYLELAPVLRDPGVSAHTTHLAQFQRREADAFEAVSLWAELEPGNVEANSTLALLLARQGQTVAAAAHLGAVARNGGKANFPVLLNGFSQLSPQQQSELTANINALAVEFPQDTELLLAQALLLDELGQEEQAVDTLQTLFDLDPQNNQAVLLEAKLLQETGARRPLRRLEAVLEDEPENSKLRLQYARMLTRDDMEAAREQFEILASQAPQDSQLLLSLALINREIGDNLTAKAYLRRMLELRQQEGQAHFFLGQIAEDDGEVESALYNYTKVKDGREFYSANARIGQIYLDRAQAEQLSAYFNQLRSRYPDRSERLFGIEADLLSRSGDLDNAVAVLTRGLDELPQSASMRYTRAMLGEQQNNLALLESDLRAIIANDPDNATALNALGYTLADRTQRYDEAQALISRALALQPQEPAILDSMGWVLYRQGDYQESIRYLRLAYESFPDPEVAAHLGEVLWASGDTRAAMEVWEHALEKDPDHQVLVSTIRALAHPRAGDSHLVHRLPVRMGARCFIHLLLTVTLVGCALQGGAPQQSPGWNQRIIELSQFDQWQAEGKLALRTADRAESVSLNWEQRRLQTRLRLSGPMGLNTTSVYSNGSILELREGDEEPRRWDISSPEAMAENTGWDLPLQALPHWLKGVPSPSDDVHGLVLEDNRARSFLQHDWQVDYQEYRQFQELTLPTRLQISRGATRVRLIIRQWTALAE